MQVKKISEKGLKREFGVTLAADAIRKAKEQRLKQLGAKMKVDGFRPGKVPLSVVEQRHGHHVMGEVLENVIQKAQSDVIKEQNLRPAIRPEIKIEKYEEGKDLEFSMKVEILPKVPALAYEKISLSRPVFTIDEKEIDEALQRLAERNKKLEPLSKGSKAKKGHVVKIDFKGMLNKVPFEGGEGKGFNLELGSNQFIPGFEDELVGVKEGDETTISVTFPKDYHKEDLAGQKAEFEIKVHGVFEAVAPKVDDEFAKSAGQPNLTKFKEAVRKQLENEYGGAVREKLKRQLFDALEDACEFDVPEGMLEMEFNTIWERLQEAKKSGDPSLDKPEDELREEYRAIAMRRVKLGILLAEVGAENKIAVTNEELTRAVMNQARMFPGQEKKVFEYYRANPERVDDLRGPILEDKAVDFILGKVKLVDENVTVEELLKPDDASEGASKKKKKKGSK